MNCLPVISAFVLLMPLDVPETAAAPLDSLSLQQILGRMNEHDTALAASHVRYTCLRRYALQNRRFHKSAELNVRMSYAAPGRKKFEILSETGSDPIRQRVLKPMLDAEEEAGRDDVRPRTRITPANYDFKLLGTEVREGRPAYLLEVKPRIRNKFLIRGRVWVDARDFGIVRVEATPAQSPSVLIYNTRVVQQSKRFGELWVPAYNHSNTDSLLFGHTEVIIESWDYRITQDPVAAALP